MPDILTIAESIARKAHADQTELSTGDDYIHHVERVVALVENGEAKAVAWLHDVLEDSQLTASGLRLAGIPINIVNSVLQLTKGNWRFQQCTYAQYIKQIRDSGDELAIAVKIADLCDHLRPRCPKSMRLRYIEALAVLWGLEFR